MKTIAWVGSKGNEIELRAHCETTMRDKTVDLDGDIINVGQEPMEDADLELWVDGKKIDSCWDTNFWRIVDANGVKKIWGLPVGMSDGQAEIVEEFLKEVIESGKSAEVIAHETKKTEAEKAEHKAEAQKIVDAAAKYTEPLMTNAQYRVWAKHYNDINNEGGEGYIPQLITVEQLEIAKKVLGE